MQARLKEIYGEIYSQPATLCDASSIASFMKKQELPLQGWDEDTLAREAMQVRVSPVSRFSAASSLLPMCTCPSCLSLPFALSAACWNAAPSHAAPPPPPSCRSTSCLAHAIFC